MQSKPNLSKKGLTINFNIIINKTLKIDKEINSCARPTKLVYLTINLLKRKMLYTGKKMSKYLHLIKMKVSLTSIHLQTHKKQEVSAKYHTKLHLNTKTLIVLETIHMNVQVASMRLKVLQCPNFQVIIYQSH